MTDHESRKIIVRAPKDKLPDYLDEVKAELKAGATSNVKRGGYVWWSAADSSAPIEVKEE